MSCVSWYEIMPTSEVTLVLNQEPRATIIAPSDGPLAYAASELQRYVEKISNAKLPITTEVRTDTKAIGPTRIIFRIGSSAVKHDGFHLHVEGDDIIVEASEARGCIYGAYALLELLGCRFYGPAPIGVIVPKVKTLKLQAVLNLIREPAFMNRIPSSGTPEEQVQWGFNFTGVASSEESKRLIDRLGLKQFRWGHIWPILIGMRFFQDGRKPEKMDYTGHEDWLPANEDGVRSQTNQSLCLSNQYAFDWFTNNAVNWMFTNCQNADYVSIWSADTIRLELCRCRECFSKFRTPPYKSATDWYLLTQNAIRKKLDEQGWYNSFGWISYHGSEDPPNHVRLYEKGRNMDFLYAPRPRGGTQHGPLNNEHPLSFKYRQNLKAWLDYLDAQDYKGTLTVFEYYYDLILLGYLAEGRTFLIPKQGAIQEDMRFYHQRGFDGFFDCNPPSDAWFPDPLSRWIYHLLMWDLDLDLKSSQDDFFKHYYGPAADAVKESREAVEKLMFEEPSQKVVDELHSLEARFDIASSIASGDKIFVTRIEGMRLWVQYCALCKDSEFHAKVTHDFEKGRATEQAIRKLLNDNKDFLINNRFMSGEDLKLIAGDVVERNIVILPYEHQAEKVEKLILWENIPAPYVWEFALLMVVTANWRNGDASAGLILENVVKDNQELRDEAKEILGREVDHLSASTMLDVLEALSKKYRTFEALDYYARTGSSHKMDELLDQLSR